MGENPTIAEQAANEMDEMLTDVMPNSWLGHARVVIFGASDLSENQKDFALKLSKVVVEKQEISAERAAELSIEKAKERVA